MGIPSEWIKVLQDEGLIDIPYRHSTAEIFGAAHDDHNLSTDNRFSEPQLREAIALNPQKIEFRLELFRWYAIRNQWDKAEEEALLAVTRAPQDRRVQYAAIQAQWRSGRISAEAATARLAPLLHTQSPPPDWLAEMSSMLLSARKPEDACWNIKQALDISPTEQYLYFKLADCLFHLGRQDALIRSIETARRLGKIPAHYEHILATAYEAQGKLQDALQAANRSVSLEVNFDNLYTQAGILLRLERQSEAIGTCEMARPFAGKYIEALERRIEEIKRKISINSRVAILET